MSPSVQRVSGPKFTKGGEEITPRALVHQCEGCGYEHAAEGITTNGKRLSYCGVIDGKPACVGRGK